jgi:hypothetical protein
VDSGGTTGGVEQLKGSANQALMADRCFTPILSLVNSEINILFYFKIWHLRIKLKKKIYNEMDVGWNVILVVDLLTLILNNEL